MKEIWKFPLEAGAQLLSMPTGAGALAAQAQHGAPCIWALVDPTARKVQRTAVVVGTGHTFAPCDLQYVGTVQLADGALVFHVFLEPELAP